MRRLKQILAKLYPRLELGNGIPRGNRTCDVIWGTHQIFNVPESDSKRSTEVTCVGKSYQNINFFPFINACFKESPFQNTKHCSLQSAYGAERNNKLFQNTGNATKTEINSISRDFKQRGQKRVKRPLRKITFLVRSVLLCAGH